MDYLSEANQDSVLCLLKLRSERGRQEIRDKCKCVCWTGKAEQAKETRVPEGGVRGPVAAAGWAGLALRTRPQTTKARSRGQASAGSRPMAAAGPAGEKRGGGRVRFWFRFRFRGPVQGSERRSHPPWFHFKGFPLLLRRERRREVQGEVRLVGRFLPPSRGHGLATAHVRT